MMRLLYLFGFLLFVSFSSYGQQVDKEYTNTLKKMFEASNQEATYEALVKQFFIQIEKSLQGDYSDELVLFKKKISEAKVYDDLLEMIAPIYVKYFTLEDLQKMIDFYETPFGKKIAKSSPLIMRESVQVGQEWGKKMMEDIMKMKEK